MLNDSHDIPYKSQIVTIIWKEGDEWFYCHDVTTKRKLEQKRPKEAFCVWTGKWNSDAFNIDWADFSKALS